MPDQRRCEKCGAEMQPHWQFCVPCGDAKDKATGNVVATVLAAGILVLGYWACVPSTAEQAKNKAQFDATVEHLRAKREWVDDCVAAGKARAQCEDELEVAQRRSSR